MVKNPVMFVVEVGSVLTTLLLVDNTIHRREGFGFNVQITLWLWFTVLFANFAEAMAEGRGKAQADTLRKRKGRRLRNATRLPARWSRSPADNFARETSSMFQRATTSRVMAR
jgi:high-affinity K+ transport system ATPase subunit B